MSNLRELFPSIDWDEIQKGPNASIGIDEDETAMGHLARCEGCANCDYLMRDYSACDTCGHWMHHSQPHHYDEGSGETLCLVCEPKEADL